MAEDQAEGADELRPVEEIAARFLALNLLVTWVVADDDEVPDTEIAEMLEEHGLGDHLTDDEASLFDLDRDDARAQVAETIGWTLENMWPLAWVLGFAPEPTADERMIDEPTMQALLFEFAPNLLAHAPRPRDVDEVARLTDRFQDAPPGEVVAERLHALVWCLSPDVEWDEV